MWSITAERVDLGEAANEAGASFSTSGRGSTSSKLFPLRSGRAETRNRAKDELRRVINAVERVRKWEQRWVTLKDSSVAVLRWVPVSGQAITPPKPAATTVASSSLPANQSDSNLAAVVAAEEDTIVSAASADNSNGEEATNGRAVEANFAATNGGEENEEDSNTGFFNSRVSAGLREVYGGDTDSNQTASYDRINYGHSTDDGTGRTDFSALIEEEGGRRTRATEGENGCGSNGDGNGEIQPKRRRLGN